MKKLFLFLFFLFLASPRPVGAYSCEDYSNNLSSEALTAIINDCSNKIQNAKDKANTLNQEITLMNDRIRLTSLKIIQTQNQIKSLEQEIIGLSGKIVRLDGSLDSLSKVLLSRVSETYKQGRVDKFSLLLSSKNVSDFIANYRYLQKIQMHDRELLLTMEQTRTSYDEQKQLKEKAQADLEKLEKQLLEQKKQLDSQILVRKKMLEETRQDENKYRQLLAQAYAEKAAIEKALVSGVKVGPVKRGDPIALVGNSGYPGCSTGKHLHFEIRKNNSWVDPGPYLSSKSVKDEQDNKGNINVGSGNWPWPIEDAVRLTQFYGQTPYSWKYKYSGGIHTGYDMVSTSSDVIRAPADGNLFKSSQMCGSSSINIVYIEHEDNVISFYLHVQ